MSGKQKRRLFEITAAAVLFAAVSVTVSVFSDFFGTAPVLKAALFLAVYAVAGYDTLWSAVQNIIRGEVFSEDLLMAVATVGAIALGEYPEAVFVMLFNKTGSLFESVAVGKSRRSISSLAAMKPKTACVMRGGKFVTVDASEVAVGEILRVRAGDAVPLDGTVISGEGTVDTSPLTGESLPVTVTPGDRVFSGCINKSGTLELRADAPSEDSAAAKVLSLIEDSAGRKARTESFITSFARYYTPTVVGLAVLITAVPTLLFGNFSEWLRRGLEFLVVSCPCALVISVPLSYFAGIGSAAREGILVKGSSYLEALAKADVAVFDKTGTLTDGRFSVTRVNCVGADERELITLAAAVEKNSSHPLGAALVSYGEKKFGGLPEAEFCREKGGGGIAGTVLGREVLVGSARFLSENGVTVPKVTDAATSVFAAADGEYLGSILFSDGEKASAAEAIARLKSLGVKETVMLTGDRLSAAVPVAEKIGIDRVEAGLLPEDKVRLLSDVSGRRDGVTLYVGDGINDAPSIAAADVGIAMGALGSDAAVECADVVLMKDDITKIPRAVEMARRVRRVVLENVIFALGVKFLILAVCAVGLGNMWLAAVADVGVSVAAILNSLRLLRMKK